MRVGLPTAGAGWSALTATPRLLLAALAGLACAAGPPALGAQPTELVVTAADTAVRLLDPGVVSSAAFLIRNHARSPASLATRLELPEGWREITGAGSLELPSGARTLTIASFGVPTDARVGRYRVTLVVGPRSGSVVDGAAGGRPSAARQASITIHVRERRQLVIEVDSIPAYISADAPGQAVFIARNVGNAPTLVRARASGGAGLVAHVDSVPFALAPGEGRVLRVDVQGEASDVRAVGARHLSMRIETGHVASAADTAVWASIRRVITVLPPAADGGSMLHRLPTRLTVRGASAAAGVQADGVTWSGSGPLREGGDLKLDFLARWSPEGVTRFGERDEYRLTLRGAGYDVRLGDQLYALSPLTEPGRYAYGASAAATRGAWTAGGYLNDDRWSGLEAGQKAGFLRFRPDARAELGLHYLRSEGQYEGSAWSMRAQLVPSPLAQLDAEYALGGGAAGDGAAWSASLAGEGPWLAYSVRVLHADTTYAGSRAGSDQRAASITLRPWDALRISATADRFDVTQGGYWPGSGARRQSRLTLDVALASAVALEYRATSRDELWRELRFDAREQALRARVNGRFGWSRVGLWAEAGTVTDLVANEVSSFRQYNLDGTITPTSWASFSGAVGQRSGRTLYGALGHRTTTGSLAASLYRRDGTRLALSAHGQSQAGPWAATSGWVDLEAARALPRGHLLSARLRILASTAGVVTERSVARLGYAIPLGAPVGRRRDMGRFAVCVVEDETDRGVPGLVFRIAGTTVVTGSDGCVAPIAVLPGAQLLRLERVGAWLDWVPMAVVPPLVTIEGGRTTSLEVRLVRAARLSGRIRRHAAVVGSLPSAGAPGELADSAGAGGLVVTIEHDGEVRQGTTDGDGAFAFGGLLPGVWTVRVAGPLPEHHVLERDSVDVALSPGGAESLFLRVLQRERRVRIVAREEVRVGPRRHVVGVAERTLADVARIVYGDADQWPKLWLANRALVADPYDLDAGTTLIVPPNASLTSEERAAAERWRVGRPRP